jgi:hypothetical protein
MARVFIVQEMPNHDIAPAMKYGDMLVLLSQYPDCIQHSTDDSHAAAQAAGLQGWGLSCY